MPVNEVIYVEGLPASGKTCLIGRLTLQSPHIFAGVNEYIDPDAAEEALVEGDETYFMRNDEQKYWMARASGLTCLVDRGHLSTLLYNRALKHVRGVETVDVDTWYEETILAGGMLPDAYIHLDTEPITSLKRRPPKEWDNVWDDKDALAFAKQGYHDYMSYRESEVPVLRLTADRMNFAEIDKEVTAFLLSDVQLNI